MKLRDQDNHSKKLVERYCNSTATDQELEVFFAMLKNNQLTTEIEDEMDKDIDRETNKITIDHPKRLSSAFKYVAAAAVAAIVISISFYFFNDKFNSIGNYKEDIQPGGDRAFLTLSNGKKIDLNKISNNQLSEETGVKITKLKSGEITYEMDQTSASSSLAYNEIATPRGGQFTVKLSDGTKIWLNSQTTIRFPVSFASLKERKVELKGEAYFEVAKDAKKIFCVKSPLQNITVLGTHFNINTFDQNRVFTTLIEGKVSVTTDNPTKNTILIPSQQAMVTKDNLQVKEVDVDQFIAWKNGYFSFDNEPLSELMRKVERWYNVNVVFENDELKNKTFSGSISRHTNVSQILKKIELTQSVKFKIDNQTITVYN